MASILCRQGETFPATHIHDSVAAVRACQGAVVGRPAAVSAVTALVGQTDLLSLLTPAAAQPVSAATTRVEAPAPKIDPKAVPASKYALVATDGTLEFFKVEVPAKGKWAGFRFVTRLIGAPGDWRKVKMPKAAQMAVLGRILDATYTDCGTHDAPLSARDLTGPTAASVRYSREHLRCAVCESPLSDQTQPGYVQGVGPVCYKRFTRVA